MKKILLSICLTLTMLFSLAQEPTQIKTFRNCVGYYNDDTEKYDYQPITYSTITFKIYDDYISADDDSHSIYRIMENLPKSINKDNEVISAKCLDEKNRNCIFALMTETNGSLSVAVIYGNYMYIYFVN